MATYTLISSQVLGSAAGSVTFSSIPQGYTDLVLRISARATVNQSNISITYNGDSSTIYSYVNLEGNSSAVASSTSLTQPAFPLRYAMNTNNNTASVFSSAEFYISNYSGATNKFGFLHSVNADNGGYIPADNLEGNLYGSNTAITSFTITPGSGSLDAASSFYLYGISNA